MHVSVYIIFEIINTMCLIYKLEQTNNTNIYEVFKNYLIYMRNNISLKKRIIFIIYYVSFQHI